MHLNSLTSTIASFAQTADALHPAERFLDLFANPLTDSVTAMAHGARIERRTAGTGQVTCHMRGDIEQKEIARLVGVTEKTMSLWVNNEELGWKTKRKSFLVTKQEQVRRLYNIIDKLTYGLLDAAVMLPPLALAAAGCSAEGSTSALGAGAEVSEGATTSFAAGGDDAEGTPASLRAVSRLL